MAAIGGFLGGVAGFVIGGPGGAAVGAALGAGIQKGIGGQSGGDIAKDTLSQASVSYLGYDYSKLIVPPDTNGEKASGKDRDARDAQAAPYSAKDAQAFLALSRQFGIG